MTQEPERLSVQHLVIGAGVVGLAIGARLARDGGEVFVLEAGPSFGSGISSRNSEVVHSGVYYPTGSLRHRLCIAGRRMLYAYCAKHGVEHRRCGKLIVATSSEESGKLEAIARQAALNEVENVLPLDGAAARALEPELNATAALLVEETGIVDTHGFMRSLVGEIEDAGGALLPRHKAVVGRRIADGFEIDVESPDGRHLVSARSLTIAAGLWTHAVAATIEGCPTPNAPPLTLAKGSYFSYSGRPAFSRLIYPVPVEGGLGTHLTLDLAGRMRFGPDVEWLSHADPDQIDFAVDPSRATSFVESIRRFWPKVSADRLTPDYSGVRPKLSGPGEAAKDFLIDGPARHGLAGLTRLFGIESPGLTSSLAIADEVVVEMGV